MAEHMSTDYNYVSWNGRTPRGTAPVRAAESLSIDTTRVRLTTERELHYWTNELSATIYALRDAIEATGTRCASVIRAYLQHGGTR